MVIVSRYPHPARSREGMMKRIEAIDRLFADQRRTYLDVVFRPLLFPIREQLDERTTVLTLHFLLHFPLILALAARARAIYVHSVFNASRVLPLYFLRRVVTDLHGLVPEEELLEGKRAKALLHGVVERIVVKRSSVLVTVSQAMTGHYTAKYGRSQADKLYLPIFESEGDAFDPARKSYPPRSIVLYSGGLQRWQNVELMFAAMKTQQGNFTFQIFTAEPERFRALLQEYGLQEAVTVGTLSKEQLTGRYEEAQFGFILRDRMALNSAACPTKLIEYASYGVIPIVLQPEIGDFEQLGYSYLLYDDFIAGRIPPANQLRQMVANNLEILEKMKGNVATGMAHLKDLCCRGGR